jgi:lipoprotein-releasing system ATP-binding protein
MSEPAIELRGVVKDYGNKVVTRVLHGVDLSVERGELVALIGPSGSGKSTLLNIMGLLDRPTDGTVLVAGVDTSRLDDGEVTRLRGRKLGFVFQFHHLLKAFTALENVYMPLLLDRGREDEAMADRARGLLERVGLAGLEGRKATELSGGQQQRVAVARALALKPDLVLADEPTGNLDTAAADQVFEVIRAQNREEGIAWLIVTHDPRIADRCDRVVRLVDGRVVSDEHRAGDGPCRVCAYGPCRDSSACPLAPGPTSQPR